MDHDVENDPELLLNAARLPVRYEGLETLEMRTSSEVPPMESLSEAIRVARVTYGLVDSESTNPVEVPGHLHGFGNRHARARFLEQAQQEKINDRTAIQALMGAVEVYAGNMQTAARLVAGIGHQGVDDPYQFALLRRGNAASVRYIYDSLPITDPKTQQSILLELAGLGNLAAIDVAMKTIPDTDQYLLIGACLKAGIVSKANQIAASKIVNVKKLDFDEKTFARAWNGVMCATQLLVGGRDVSIEPLSRQKLFGVVSEGCKDVGGSLVEFITNSLGSRRTSSRQQEVESWQLRRLGVLEALESRGLINAAPKLAHQLEGAREATQSATLGTEHYKTVLKLGGDALTEYVGVYLKDIQYYKKDEKTRDIIAAAAQEGEFELAFGFVSSLQKPVDQLGALVDILKSGYDQGHRFGLQDEAPTPLLPLSIGKRTVELPAVTHEFDGTPDDVLFSKIIGLVSLATLDRSTNLEEATRVATGIANPQFRQKALDEIRAKQEKLEQNPW